MWTKTIILGIVEKDVQSKNVVSRHVDGMYQMTDSEIMWEHPGILLSIWMDCNINENIHRSNEDIAEWLVMTISGKN